jgi:site-specific recombinase XerD
MGRYTENRISGTLGTHTMRKTFANKVHVLLGRDLVKTQRALGHKNVSSTVSYLSFLEEEIDEAILAL